MKPNAILTFVDYQVVDGGTRLHFVCTDPGPGLANDYYVLATDAQVSAIATLQDAANLATTLLLRAIRSSGISSKLDQLIGRSVTL